ncbi:hypothetical protein A3711_02820 [Erythrobacter sp. HI00D59]|nr:hypothetical protein A3711_02820 [Erythrobacter sp. HI00D59]
MFCWWFLLQRSSPVATFFVSIYVLSIAVAFATVDTSPTWLFAGAKMFIPFFIGLCFAGRTLSDHGRLRLVLIGTCVVAFIGVALDQLFEFPWSATSLTQFGVEKTVERVWWIQGQLRIGGFSGESTMTALMAFLSWLLVVRTLKPGLAFTLLGLVIYVAVITTSRTSLVAASVVGVFLFLSVFMFAELRSVRSHRIVAVGSFGLIAIPLILIVFSASIDFADIDLALRSFQIRIDESWRYPFTFFVENSPQSLIFGCGMGCLTYPMEYSEWAMYRSPIDNFYIMLYGMFGLSTLVIIVLSMIGVSREIDRGRLVGILGFNVAALTIDANSPTLCLLVFGYSISAVLELSFRRSDSITSEFRRPLLQ